MSSRGHHIPGHDRVAVIGAGLAGLTAALDLIESGRRVVLIERRPFAGGKAYSFNDPTYGVALDNGQHITMRCCTAYQEFLERIDCADVVRYQPRLEVAVVDPSARGRRISVLAGNWWQTLDRLGVPNLPAPLHLAPSMIAFEHLSLGEKSRLALALEPIRRMGTAERLALEHRSFADWLQTHRQSRRAIERFWDLIVLPTCNDRSEHVSAAQAIQVFQVGFSSGYHAADIGLFTRGLGEVAEAAMRRLSELGTRIELGAPARGIVMHGTNVAGIRYGRDTELNVDGVVIALPPHKALDLIPPAWRRREPFWRLSQHEVSPIVNVHMQWDRQVMRRDFVAVLDRDAQFIFNRSDMHGWRTPPHWISVSLSGARDIVNRPQPEITERVERAVRRALPRTARASVLATRVIKESEATFRPRPGMRAHRVGPKTPIANLALAGAWTDTDWPATMESAVRSGHAAAALLEHREEHPGPHPGADANAPPQTAPMQSASPIAVRFEPAT